jgi:hypothetical protein
MSRIHGRSKKRTYSSPIPPVTDKYLRVSYEILKTQFVKRFFVQRVRVLIDFVELATLPFETLATPEIPPCCFLNEYRAILHAFFIIDCCKKLKLPGQCD